MALQMATNISPDALNGVGGGVFNALDGLTVSWQVNGASPLLAYRIVLQENDAESTQVYTTGKVVLDDPFYGVTYNGTVQYFEAATISAADLATATVANGNAYKMLITQWWGATDADSITQSSASLIEAWTPPTLTMTAIPNPLTVRAHSFTATYAQAEGDTISWVRWRIAEAGSEDTPLLDTGNIYGTSQLQADYDAFFTGASYSVRCDVETAAGQEATTGWQTFAVSYSTIAPNGLLEVGCRPDGSIGVSWDSARTTIGTAVGDYRISNGDLILQEGSTVTWDEENGEPLSYAAPWTVFWRGEFTGNGGTFLTIELEGGGSVILSISQSGSWTDIDWDINGMGSSRSMTSTIKGHVWSVAITADKIYTARASGTGGLYPNNSSYPGNSVYPKDNAAYNVTTYTDSVSYTQAPIKSIKLTGDQITHWLWVNGESMSAADVGTVMADTLYEPTFTGDTVFLASFAEGLNGGNLNTTGYSLYRRNLTTNAYQKIADMDVNQLALIDHAATNNHTYSYQLWYTDAATFISQPIESAEVSPCTWNYVLLACSQNESGVYHPQKEYRFAANISTGDGSNNNAPQVQKNFTRYPSWQADTANYMTGTLKAYIGRIDKQSNLYVGDTVELADELRGLSQSEYTLFLKDRRGDLRMVRTSNAITTKIEDKWPTQTMEISLPWVEVGDATGVSIVNIEGDALWPDDEIVDTRVRIDPDTGLLMWIEQSQLALDEVTGILRQIYGSQYTPANLSISIEQYLQAILRAIAQN